MAHQSCEDLLKRRGALMASLRGSESQEACAQRAGIHQTTWSGYERGAHDMSIKHAVRISEAFGVSVAEVLAGTLNTGIPA